MEDSETGGPSSISVRMEYLLLNSDIVNLVWKTRGGDRKHYFINFCSFRLCRSQDNVPV